MNRWSEKKQKNRIKTQFGKNPMDMENWESLQLRMYEIEMYEQRRRKTFNQEWVDDVTWNDLEMDRVFARINHTRTYMGEQILYHRLHGCKNRQKLQRMEKRIAFFSCQESSRIKVEEKLSHIGKQKENYYLPLFFKHPKQIKRSAVLFYFVHFGAIGRLLPVSGCTCSRCCWSFVWQELFW